jgi:hypothetical protein
MGQEPCVRELSFYEEFTAAISSPKRLKESSSSLQSGLVDHLLSKEKKAASRIGIERFFGPYRVPGTSSIGLRRVCPELFQDTIHDAIEPYDQWLTRTVNSILLRMASYHPAGFGLTVSARFREELVEKVRLILDFRDKNGTLLCDLIPQQMYEDVFIRMLTMMIEKKTTVDEPYLYETFNKMCHRLAMSLLSCLETGGILHPEDSCIRSLIHISVLSGYVGINLKSSASAASTLLNRDLLPIEESWIKDMASVRAVPDRELDTMSQRMLFISRKSGGAFGLDSLDMYFKEVIHASDPTLLIFFSDDYLETVIDLKRFELMMARNPLLSVLFVPRNGRYGNDFACEDIPVILSEPGFEKLALLHGQGRFVVCPEGPMAGCIDVRYVSETLIRQIETLSQQKTLVFETKGCRNFEMIQGQLSAPWYTSFNCNRALSIRTVGIDMEPVFLRIPSGMKAYDGFTVPREGRTPSGRIDGIKFARMTTRNLYDMLEGSRY